MRLKALVTVMLLLTAMLASLTVERAALGQAGSAGGTIGKQDKSISGVEEKPVLRKDRSRIEKPILHTRESTKSPAIPKVFQNPTINGVRVDWCMTSSLGMCGEVAATAWCRSQGLSHATSFKWAVAPPTYRQGERNICNGYCGGFTEVICQ